jgi:hypothetical protein
MEESGTKQRSNGYGVTKQNSAKYDGNLVNIKRIRPEPNKMQADTAGTKQNSNG